VVRRLCGKRVVAPLCELQSARSQERAYREILLRLGAVRQDMGFMRQFASLLNFVGKSNFPTQRCNR